MQRCDSGRWEKAGPVVIGLLAVATACGGLKGYEIIEALPPPPDSSGCISFMPDVDRANPSPVFNEGLAALTAYPSTKWKQGDLGKGMWVGLVVNSGTGTSTTYNLPAHDSGCVYFRHSSAWFGRVGQAPVAIQGVYCTNGGNPANPKPHWESDPNCKALAATLRGKTSGMTVTAIPDSGLISVASQDPGLLPEATKLLMAITTVPGAWFPCNSNGCCRAS